MITLLKIRLVFHQDQILRKFTNPFIINPITGYKRIPTISIIISIIYLVHKLVVFAIGMRPSECRIPVFRL